MGTAKVIQLSSSYSCRVIYTGSTTVTFQIPSGYTYLGAGLHSYTPKNGSGGCNGIFDIVCINNVLTLTITMGGNWGDTTIYGEVVLNVFVV